MELVKELSESSITKRKIIGLYLITLSLMMFAMMIPVAHKGFKPSIILLAVTLLLTFLMMVAHELLHGICFKIFTGKVKMGMKWSKKYGPYGYAMSPGSIMSKRQMITTLLMPQIIALACLILVLLPIQDGIRFSAWSVAIGSLGGGCMDIYMVINLLKYKEVTHVQDTVGGINLMKEVTG